MQPINYMLDVQSPIQTALAGYMQGKQFRAQEQGMEMKRQQFDMQKQQFETAQAQIAQQQARAQELQGMMAQFAEQVAMGDVTAQDVIQMQVPVPEMAESIGNAWSTLSEQQTQGKIQEYSKLAVAMRRNPDLALQMIDDRILAAENAGDMEQLNQMKAIKAQAEMNPEAVMSAVLMELATVMPTEQFENFMSIAMPPKPEAASSEGKILQDYQAGFFGPPGTPEAIAKAEQALENQKRQPLIGNLFGDTLKTGQLAPETALVEDPDAPGGLRIIPLTGGTAESAKETAAATADDVIKTLEELKTLPGAKNRYGLSSAGGFIPPIPGSEEANAQAVINKVKGAAFLQAFETLKGGGQITQIEGEKATAAITVLQDQNISWEFALKAADELIDIVKAAKARKAKGETVAPAAQAPTPGEQSRAVPETASRYGITAEVWAGMTPEEKAAFED